MSKIAKILLIAVSAVVFLFVVFEVWIIATSHISLRVVVAQGAQINSVRVRVCGSPVSLDRAGANTYSYEGRMRCEGEINLDLVDSSGAVIQHRLCYISGYGAVRAKGLVTPVSVTLNCSYDN